MKKIIVIDAGHGGFDPGAESRGLTEKNITLHLALLIQDVLSVYSNDIEVIMTRTIDESPLGSTDKNGQLLARAEIANEANADLFLSIHVNAAGGEGFESYVMEGVTDQETLDFQKAIHEPLAKFYMGYGCEDRGMMQADFSVLRNTHMPALLIENLFIDDTHDAGLLTNGQVLDGIAHTIVNGLLSFVGVVPHDVTSSLPPVAIPMNEEMIAAIAFAKDHGIMLGYSDGSFGEHDAVTRGQLAVVLYRIHAAASGGFIE